MRINIQKILSTVILSIGLFSPIATHAYIFVDQGGTGAGTLTGCLQGNGTSPITGTGLACGSGGGGGVSPALPYGGVQYSALSGTTTVLNASSSFTFSTSTGSLNVPFLTLNGSATSTLLAASSTSFFANALKLGASAISYIQGLFSATTPIVDTTGVISCPTCVTNQYASSTFPTFTYASSTYYLASNPNGYTSNAGTVTSITATSPLTGGTISTSGSIGCQTASGSQAGCLASADWTTFNNKLLNLLGGLNAILGNSTTTNATTTSLAITGLSNTILAVNANGTVIATTTSAGGVTAVNATSPVLSSGGATPTISLLAASTSQWNSAYASTTALSGISPITYTGSTGAIACPTCNTSNATVSSVALTVPTGLSVSGSPITTSGTFGLTLTSGYNIPLTASTTNWNGIYNSITNNTAGYVLQASSTATNNVAWVATSTLGISGGGGGGSSQWTGTAGGPIYYASPVSIGTSSYLYGLTIATDTDIDNGLFHASTTNNTITINTLQEGAPVFQTDAGVVSALDEPVDASATVGTLESYSFNNGGTPVMTVYGVSSGAGTTTNLGIGIGTTTPSTALYVIGTTSASGFTDTNAVADFGTGGSTAIACYLSTGALGHITITSLLASGSCVAN